MPTSNAKWLTPLLLQCAALALGGCFQWKHDVTEGGAAFRRVRMEANGLLIGELKEDTLIGGRPCKQGWVHLLPSGVPIGFTAFREIDLGRLTIPAETWVQQNKDGVITLCAFPRDYNVQGHLCRGSGGPEGFQAAFYADGALKQFYLRRDTEIQGVPCSAGIFNESVGLHENGRLKFCVLSEDFASDGRTYLKGTFLRFNSDGRVVP